MLVLRRFCYPVPHQALQLRSHASASQSSSAANSLLIREDTRNLAPLMPSTGTSNPEVSRFLNELGVPLIEFGVETSGTPIAPNRELRTQSREIDRRRRRDFSRLILPFWRRRLSSAYPSIAGVPDPRHDRPLSTAVRERLTHATAACRRSRARPTGRERSRLPTARGRWPLAPTSLRRKAVPRWSPKSSANSAAATS